MMSAQNTLLLIVGICVFLIVAWTVNPMVWRVQRLFPSATISDLYDATVDLNQLRGIPWCFLKLHRCRISDLSILKEMNILDSHCDVYFDDCDISAVPHTQFTPGFYSLPKDPKHFTFDKPP
jgi:hypothetical protein